MAGLGDLVVHLAANTAEFSSDLGRAAHIADKNMKSISDAATKAGIALQAMAVAGAAGMIAMTKSALDSADAMGKMAQSAGLGVETFSEFAYAARLANVDTETFAKATEKLGRALVDASKGLTEPKLAFDALGIKIRDAQGALKSTADVLPELADRFAAMRDGPEKTALAMAVLGKAGAALIPLLNEGSEGLRRNAEEARKFGIVITDEASRDAQKFNDNLTRLNAVFQGMSNAMAQATVGPLNDLAEELLEIANRTDLFTTAGKAAVITLQTLAILAANTAYVFRTTGKDIGGWVAVLDAVGRKDFRTAFNVWDAMKEDAKAGREALDSFEQRILSIGETVKKGYYDLGAKPKLAAPDIGGILESQKAADQAAKDAQKQMEAMADVEAKGWQELQKIRADDAAESRKFEQDKVDAIFAAGQKMGEVELDSYTELAKLRADAQAKEREENYKYAAEGYEQVRQSLMTETELLGEQYAQRLDYLISAHEQHIITDEQFAADRQAIAEENERELTRISNKGLTDREKFSELSLRRQAKTIFGELADITAGVAQHNRGLFELNKVAGIANAIINAYEGISLTMSKYPFPLNIAMAAAHGVAAFAQVKAIQGSQFGSGGSAPSIAGGTPATPVTPVTGGQPQSQSGQTTIVQLSGADLYSDKSVRELLKRIKETTDKGGKLVIA